MKELSIEEKAKAYDEALKYAKIYYTSGDEDMKMMMKTCFPVLVEESEDEKIRRWIINYLDNKAINSGIIQEKTNIKNAIAWLKKKGEQVTDLPRWKYKKDNTPLLRDSIILNKYGGIAKSPADALVSDVWVLDYDELAKLPKEEVEKQGEQKPVDKVEPKFKVGDEIRTKNEESLIITRIDRWGYWSEDLFICNFDDADKWELVEQNPAWSEEDEAMQKTTILYLENTKDSCAAACVPYIVKCINWLKSLRPQNHWKPNLAQLNALSIVSNGNAPDDIEAIVSLYQDLLKLKD